MAIGLADGVGGWQDSGVDPSDFSHGLCGYMAGEAYEFDGQAGKLPRPMDLLQTAYDTVIANPRILAGGSTAIAAVLDGKGGMDVANLGDSGYVILRPGLIAVCSTYVMKRCHSGIPGDLSCTWLTKMSIGSFQTADTCLQHTLPTL